MTAPSPMTRRLLVVDDEQQIRKVLRAYLENDGFAVVEAGTGADALRQVAQEAAMPFDLVVLDIGLPDLDGIDVLRTLRQNPESAQLPVILVTARAEEVDKLIGLSVGADDYITKPFSPREVVARVKTVLRRSTAQGASPPSAVVDPGVRDFADFHIDIHRREITVGTRLVHLSTLEFDLLDALTSSAGRVFSRSQLLEQVWGYDYFGDERLVDVHIRSIRKALGDSAVAPRIIGTVRGVGYKLLSVPVTATT